MRAACLCTHLCKCSRTYGVPPFVLQDHPRRKQRDLWHGSPLHLIATHNISAAHNRTTAIQQTRNAAQQPCLPHALPPVWPSAAARHTVRPSVSRRRPQTGSTEWAAHRHNVTRRDGARGKHAEQADGSDVCDEVRQERRAGRDRRRKHRQRRSVQRGAARRLACDTVPDPPPRPSAAAAVACAPKPSGAVSPSGCTQP